MLRGHRGSSLIELLVVLATSSLLLGALYNTVTTQQKVFASQEQVADAQQNGRVGIDRMAREIRMAGYKKDILESLGHIAGFTKVLTPVNGANHVGKNDDEIAIIVAGKAIVYRLQWDAADSTLPVLVRNEDGVTEVLADNIENLQFEYTLKDGTLTDKPGNSDDVRTVRVTLVARSRISDPDLTAGDGYRRREFSSLIKIRNMGSQS